MIRLIHSAKFLTAVLDAVVSTALLLGTRFLSPADLDFMTKLVAIYQPVFVLVIAGFAYEDAALKGVQEK